MKLGVEIINFKITNVGRFSIFHAKLQKLRGGFSSFLSIFCHFLSFFQAEIEFLEGLGGLFE